MIILLHFHKAAGSTIVEMLKRNKKFFEPNKNGNPAYQISYNKSATIDYWSREKKDIEIWINKQRYNGVEVMCLEWNFFNPHNFISDNINYIVCFRDPLKTGPFLQLFKDMFREEVPVIDVDRILHHDMVKAEQFLNNFQIEADVLFNEFH